MECAHVPTTLFLVQTERTWRWVLLSTSPGSCFPLGIEEDSSNRESEVIVLSELSSAEVIPCGWWMDCLPSLLLEQCKHKSVYSYVGPWYLISHHLPSCALLRHQHQNQSLVIHTSSQVPLHPPMPHVSQTSLDCLVIIIWHTNKTHMCTRQNAP